MHKRRGRPIAWVLLVGALAGAGHGAVEAGVAVAVDKSVFMFERAVATVVSASLLTAVAGAAFAVALLIVLPRTPRSSTALAIFAGVCAGAAIDLTAFWFSDPPPFTETFPGHGNPLIFLLIGLAVLLLSALSLGRLAWGLPVVGVLGLVPSLAPLMSSNDQPSDVPELPKNAPNVLLVTLDTTRADHVSADRDDRVKTPTFDAIAARGVSFERAYAQIPVTGPSHLTLLSGRGPWEHGNLLNGLPVPDSLVLFSETLAGAGWRTGGFVSAYVLDGELGFSRGFEVYDDDPAWLLAFSDTAPGRLLALFQRATTAHPVLERRARDTVDRAIAWLERGDSDRPFFLWLHLFDPHGPYAPPPPWDTHYYTGDPRDPGHTSMSQVEGVAPYLERSLRGITDLEWVLAQYAGEVSYADQQVGRVVQWLQTRGELEETLIVYTADHGESLGEHGVWFNHGDDVREPSVAVPLAIALPGNTTAREATTVSAPVELTDLAATVLEVTRVPPPATLGGHSLVPAMRGERFERPFARSICLDRPANQLAREAGEIEHPRWRSVALNTPHHTYIHRESERFSDEVSPPEIDPEVREVLQAEARALLEGMAEDALDRGARRDADTLQRLQALGYVE